MPISVSASSISAPEGNSSGHVFSYTVTNTGTTDSYFSWSVTGMSADASDFAGGVLPSSGGSTITLSSGQSHVVSIQVNGDFDPEPDENFQVTFSSSDSSGGGSNPDVIEIATIEDDDGYIPSSYSIAPSSQSQFEGDSGAQIFSFTIIRTGNTSYSEGVSWSVSGGGASGTDFFGGGYPAGVVFFGVGVTSVTIDVPVAGDLDPESDESFTLSLYPYFDGGSEAVLPLLASATGTILDDDTIIVEPPSVSIEPATISQSEGDSGATTYTYTLTRSDSAGTASVSWSVAGRSGNPADAADFVGGVAPSGRVTFGPGETTAVIEVQVNGDTRVEPDEGFVVRLSSPDGVVLGADSAAGMIVNDDVPSVLNIGPATISQAEGDAGARVYTYTVTRSGGLDEVSTINWSVDGLGLSPADAADFVGGVLPSGVLTFASGETTKTIQIQVAGDRVLEPNEQFQVNLSAPTNATIGLGGQAIGLIVNDDQRVILPLFAPQAQVLAEGADGQQTEFTFTLRRFGDLGEAATGAWTLGAPTSGASASAGDFLATSGTVSFAAGAATAQITVTVIGDSGAEETEGFEVLVTLPGTTAVVGRGVIINDDLAIAAPAASEADPFAEFALLDAGPQRVEVICDYDLQGWGGF